MSLFINQGVQDVSQDKQDFPKIIDNDVIIEITGIKLNPYKVGAINVELKLLSGKYKGIFAFESIDYDPKSNFSWKYRSIRECAGVPYQKNEPVNIDIEALLLHKVLKADFTIDMGKDKDGNPKEYQRIKYKKYVAKGTVNTAQPASVQVPNTAVPVQLDNNGTSSNVVKAQVKAQTTPLNTNTQPVQEEQTPAQSTINDADDWD